MVIESSSLLPEGVLTSASCRSRVMQGLRRFASAVCLSLVVKDFDVPGILGERRHLPFLYTVVLLLCPPFRGTEAAFEVYRVQGTAPPASVKFMNTTNDSVTWWIDRDNQTRHEHVRAESSEFAQGHE
jgi:hypothetical protein